MRRVASITGKKKKGKARQVDREREKQERKKNNVERTVVQNSQKSGHKSR